MKLNRVMLAATKSGSGKTTITCGLLQVLKNKHIPVVSYKCGPDYIDPMFHQKVIGVPSKNLDTFFTGEDLTRQLLLDGRTEDEFAVLEGVMGLFDGLGGIREEGSSYHLAKVTGTPIILVVDAKGMGRSVLPLLAGFLKYDKEHLIKGVILNRMSKYYYDTIKPVIEEELDITVVGYVPDCRDLAIESRHLGLFLPEEIGDLKNKIERLAGELQTSVSIDTMMQIAGEADQLKLPDWKYEETDTSCKTNAPVIAVARDEAFCFYYEDNLRMLQRLGADLQFFSPIHDTKLPKACSAILLGGGYPELYAKELSSNDKMKEQIRQAIANGMPVVAECGGFMYLHNHITDQEHHSYAMAGVVDAGCGYQGKLVRFGYIELEEKASNFLPQGEKIKGHEFHYFDSQNNGTDCVAIKPVTGRTYPCVISRENCWMGFPHLYYPSNPAFARNFVQKARSYNIRNGE